MRTFQIRSLLAATATLLVSTSALATDYTWIGNKCNEPCCGGEWSTPDYWSPKGVPGKDDTATLSCGATPGSNITGMSGTVKGMNLSGTIHLDGGALTVAPKAGDAPGTAKFTWHGGSVAAVIDVAAGASLVMDQGTHILTGGKLLLHGDGTWSGGELKGAGDALFENDGTLTLTSTDAADYDAGLNTATFVNTGTLVVNLTGTKSIKNPWGFHNTGTVTMTSGTLSLEQAGNSAHRFSDGTVFSGPGRVVVTEPLLSDAASLELSGTITVSASSTIEFGKGSDVYGTATLAGPGTYAWTGGVIDESDDGQVLTVAKGATLSIEGAGEKQLGGPTTIDNQGTTVWTGTGPITAAGGATFVNHGTFTAKNDASFGYSSAGGTNGATFDNQSLFVKDGGTGVTAFTDNAWGLSQHGVIDVKTGTLELHPGGNDTHLLADGSTIQGAGRVRVVSTDAENAAMCVLQGKVTVAAGGTLELGPGSATTADGSVVGPGTLVWSGGSLVVASDGEGAALLVDAATHLSITGDTLKVLGTGTLDVSGPTTWDGTGDLEISGSTLVNRGTFTATSDALLTYNSSGAVQNKGTFLKDGGTGSTRIENNFANEGTVELRTGTLFFSHGGYALYSQTAGVTRLAGGTLAASESTSEGNPRTPITFAGGSVEGTGTIDADVTVATGVTVRPGGAAKAGALTVSGSYTQQDGATLAVDLGAGDPGKGYDQLRVTGVASLAGTLATSLLAGFTPAQDQAFVVTTFASRDDATLALSQPEKATLSATYHATDLTLNAAVQAGSGGSAGSAGSGAAAGSSGGGDPDDSGCSTTGRGASGGWLVALAAWMASRRRRAVGPRVA